MKVKLSKYAKMEGVSTKTLRRRIESGTLKAIRSESGHIYIELDQEQPKTKVAIYARVSSSENKDNLRRQKDRLISYCNAKGYKVDSIIEEIGSGLNDERKKLESLLMDRSITVIVVEHKDRFARFGINYVQKLLELDKRRIEIVNPVEDEQDDLMQDFVSIITSFVARLYGKRRTKRKVQLALEALEKE